MFHKGKRSYDVAIQPNHAAALGHVLALQIYKFTIDILKLLLAALLLCCTSVLRLYTTLLVCLIISTISLLKACAVGWVVIQHRAHHVHDLAAPLLQLLHLGLHVLDVHDVAKYLADGLQEPEALDCPVQPVSLLLRPILDEASVEEELRMVKCQVAYMEKVSQSLDEDHLDR